VPSLGWPVVVACHHDCKATNSWLILEDISTAGNREDACQIVTIAPAIITRHHFITPNNRFLTKNSPVNTARVRVRVKDG
jgi:hypothetical protein